MTVAPDVPGGIPLPGVDVSAFLTLDRLRDRETGAYLAPVRADGKPVTGLPAGQKAPVCAVLDTGLDVSHPWIAATVIESIDFTGQGEADRNGHGTWVALTFLQLCPMPVGLLNVRVLGDDGTGSPDALARGIRWAARHGATVINVSAGVNQPWCQGDCAVCRAALAASDDGISVHVAAGNEPGIAMCPAKAAATHPQSLVISAGALNEVNTAPAYYSGNGGVYLPDLIVPGFLLPVPPAGEDPGGRDPKYREASAYALLRQAVGQAILGDAASALRELDEVAARCADDPVPEVRALAPMALLNKGSVFHEQGRFQDEIACYTAAIDRYGAQPESRIRAEADDARYRRAGAHERQGDTAAAMADYTEIIRNARLTPEITAPNWMWWKSVAWAFVRRSELLRAQHRRQEADADLAAARPWFEQAASNGHVDASVGYGDALAKRGDVQGARNYYLQAIATGHGEWAPTAARNLGVLLMKQGDVPGAVAAFKQALASGHPDHAPAAALALGVLLDTELGDVQGAMDCYRQAIASGHPDHAPSAARNLGMLLNDQGDVPGAVAAFKQAVGFGHRDHTPAAEVALGLLFRQQGDEQGARDCFTRAIASGHPQWAPEAAANLR